MTELWEIKTQEEAGILPPTEDATFATLPLKGGGVTTWIDLWKMGPQYPTTKWLLSLTGQTPDAPIDNPDLASWAIKSKVTGVALYNLIGGHLHWPIMVCASPNPKYYTKRQRVAIDRYDGAYAHLAGIPEMNDYRGLTAEFLIDNGYGGLAYVISPSGRQELVNGKLFCVPYFSSGFYTSAGFDGNLWLSRHYLVGRIGNAQPITPVMQYMVTASLGLRLRISPDPNSIVIEVLPFQTLVSNIGDAPSNGFLNVQAPDGKVGWASMDWLVRV